jgi:formiminotetrahydrofolate cyclodeaminase
VSSDGAGRRDLLGLRLGEFLQGLAAAGPIPAGGAAAAITAAMAASLVTMVARSSAAWEDAPGVAAQATALRERLSPLALADAEAYAGVIAALNLPDDLADEERNLLLGDALARAADLPLAIAEAALDVAELAAHAAAHAQAAVRGDALAAATLAEAAVCACARLVDVNLATTKDDPRVARCTSLARDAAAAVARAQDGT